MLRPVDNLWRRWITHKTVENSNRVAQNDFLRYYVDTMSITYQPKKKKRAKKHGFLSRSKTHGGKRVIKTRRQKGRKKLTV